MTCPFYSQMSGEHNCLEYGRLSESKAMEECMNNFGVCLEWAKGSCLRDKTRLEQSYSDLSSTRELETLMELINLP